MTAQPTDPLPAPLASKLQRKNFLVIGRAGMDFYPEPPGASIEQASSYVAHLGGSSANISVALVRHGLKASLLTCVSDDAIGRFCLRQLDQYGVDRRFVRSVGGEYRNSLAVSESRMKSHATVIYRHAAADFRMTVDDVQIPDYQAFGGLITTGTVLAAEPSRSSTFKAFDLAREAGLPLIFDLDYRPYSWSSAAEASEVYSRAALLCDVIVGNDVEFGFMAGDYAKGLDKARQLAKQSASLVVYKMGEKGAITLIGNRELKTGIYPTTALKPTGAGDSFLGGLIASLAAGFNVEDSILRGSACASIVVSRVGCAPAMPDSDDLDAFLARHPGPQQQ